jgi:tetratricopeptide (TPR) repeat protein/TolB-like protein
MGLVARAAAALLGAGLAAGGPGIAAGQILPGTTVVVLPFESSGEDARLAWLREGAAVLVTDLLAEGGEAAVDRDERLRAFERLQLPPLAVLSRASAIRVGQVLGASAVVIGALEPSGTALTVRARLIRLDTGRLLPEVVERGSLSDPFAIFGRVARALAGSGPGAGAAVALPPSPQAFEFYIKGLVADSVADQRALLEQSLTVAPSYARVRMALWELHSEQGEFQRALEVVTSAPAGGRAARDARFAAALSLMALKRFDEAYAQLNGLQSEARSAVVANAMGVIQLRRGSTPQTGVATYFFTQAAEIDPAGVDYFFNLGYAYALDRDYPAALYWLREAVRRDPADGDAHFVLSVTLTQTGAGPEASREAELAARLSARHAARDAKAAAAEPVPRGLERLPDRLTQPAARVDSMIMASGQRDQQSLADFHLDAGRRAFAREADREAVAELRRALFLSPYLAEAHLLLGRLHLRGGRPDEAVDAFKIAIWSEESAVAHVALAEAYLALSEIPSARAEIERALAIDPKFGPALALRDKVR